MPLPIKLSKIIEFLFVANCKARSIVPIGLGLGKSFLSNLSSLTKISVPRSLFTSLKSQIDVDFIFHLHQNNLFKDAPLFLIWHISSI